MEKTPQALTDLHEALKASKVGKHMTKIDWEDWPRVLSIRNKWGGEHNDRIVHITLNEAPGKFNYHALSNERLNNSEKYLTIEEKEGVPNSAILEVATKLLTP